MLQRSSQVGEFYRMSPPPVFDTTKALPPTYMGGHPLQNEHLACLLLCFPSCVSRFVADISIYDEEMDRHVHIPFQQALYATCFGDASESLVVGDIFGLANLDDTTVKIYNAHKAVVEASLPAGVAAVAAGTAVPKIKTATGGDIKDGAGLKDLGKKLKATTATAAEIKEVLESIIGLVAAGVWCPVEIVIVRPFIEHLMLSAIMTVAGRDTGATLFGPADMCAGCDSLAPAVRTGGADLRLPCSQANLGQHQREDD